MSFFFLTLFGISLVGIVIMVVYRSWELETQRVVIKKNKKYVSLEEELFTILLFLYKKLSFFSSSAHGFYKNKARRHIAETAKKTVVYRKIKSTVDVVKGKIEPTKQGNDSSFLKAVAEHKKKIRGNK